MSDPAFFIGALLGYVGGRVLERRHPDTSLAAGTFFYSLGILTGLLVFGMFK